MAQFKFFSHNQNGESFLNYYANLKQLVVECGFGEQEETIMKSRIILGIRDPELQERLLRNSISNLSEIVQYCKNAKEANRNKASLHRRSEVGGKFPLRNKRSEISRPRAYHTLALDSGDSGDAWMAESRTKEGDSKRPDQPTTPSSFRDESSGFVNRRFW
ncbi:hypothetical protein M8J77_005698 [Diaphorina citri]|nr:hypothetical protein M8J77_005698 [Diaphorina citri]